MKSKERKANLPSTGSSPSVSSSDHQGEEKSHLTISDWVNYLTSEKFGVMGTVLNVSAVLVALVALIYSTSTGSLWSSIASGIVTLALTYYLLWTIFKPFGLRGKVTERLLRKIMSGELKSEESIRKAWLEETKSIKSKRNFS